MDFTRKLVIALNSLHNPTSFTLVLEGSIEGESSCVFEDLGFIPIIREFLHLTHNSRNQAHHQRLVKYGEVALIFPKGLGEWEFRQFP